MTIKTLTTTLLLATSFLLFTACNDNAKTEKNTTTDTNTIIDGSDGNTNTSNGTTTGGSGDGDNNATTSPTAALISLTLTIEKTSLNKDENISIKVMATYEDGTSKDITEQAEWVMTPKDAVKVTEKILIAKKDNPTTLKAKMGNIFSNTMNLNITWIVNGHTLPPEPDSQVNNSTLLGIDLNDNGIRDDVERWIYEKYQDKHPIHIDIAMQGARAKQKMLKDPSKAKEIHDEMSAPLDCESYYKVCVDKPMIETRINSNYFRKIIFNTPDRKNAYLEYNRLLSGDSYAIPWCSERKQACDFNIGKYEK